MGLGKADEHVESSNTVMHYTVGGETGEVIGSKRPRGELGFSLSHKTTRSTEIDCAVPNLWPFSAAVGVTVCTRGGAVCQRQAVFFMPPRQTRTCLLYYISGRLHITQKTPVTLRKLGRIGMADH